MSRYDLMRDKIQRDVTKLIGDEINGSIHIDESSFHPHSFNRWMQGSILPIFSNSSGMSL